MLDQEDLIDSGLRAVAIVAYALFLVVVWSAACNAWGPMLERAQEPVVECRAACQGDAQINFGAEPPTCTCLPAR